MIHKNALLGMTLGLGLPLTAFADNLDENRVRELVKSTRSAN